MVDGLYRYQQNCCLYCCILDNDTVRQNCQIKHWINIQAYKMNNLETKKALTERVSELGGEYVASTSSAVIWSRGSDYVAHSFRLENGKAILFWGHYECTKFQAIDAMIKKTTAAN